MNTIHRFNIQRLVGENKIEMRKNLMRKYIALSLLVLTTSAQAEYNAYKLTAAYQLCGVMPLTIGSFEILKDVILEEQTLFAAAIARDEYVENQPTKAEMDACTKAITNFNQEIKRKFEDANSQG